VKGDACLADRGLLRVAAVQRLAERDEQSKGMAGDPQVAVDEIVDRLL
jgi:hypothetical protein